MKIREYDKLLEAYEADNAKELEDKIYNAAINAFVNECDIRLLDLMGYEHSEDSIIKQVAKDMLKGAEE